jgi:hypothetical protein
VLGRVQVQELPGYKLPILFFCVMLLVNEAKGIVAETNKGVSLREHQRDIDRLESRISGHE